MNNFQKNSKEIYKKQQQNLSKIETFSSDLVFLIFLQNPSSRIFWFIYLFIAYFRPERPLSVA